MKRLTNDELAVEFARINALRNCFDRMCAFKKFNRTYKRSEFYRATHMPISKAIGLFTINKLLVALYTIPSSISGESLALEINDFMNTLDIEVAIHRLFNSVDYTHLEKTLKAVTGADEDWEMIKTAIPDIKQRLESLFAPK